MIVLDASATLAVLLNSPSAARIAARLFVPGETLHAPHLLDLEVAQALRRYFLKGELDSVRADEAFNDVLEVVQDNTEVHRVVMPYRAWDLLDIVGREHAHTMLRQSVRYCVKAECGNHNDYARGGSR